MENRKRSDRTSSFPATSWTLVACLQDPTSPAAAQALEAICRAYWYPLYVFARRSGLEDADAQDAVQDLFACMIGRNALAQADAARGRLRTLLLTALKNGMNREREKQRSAKRGGNQIFVPLDLTNAEGRYLHEAVMYEDASAECAFERKWAVELIRAAKAELKAFYAEGGRAEVFHVLAPALDEGETWTGSGGAAATLRLSAGAVKVALHRLRKRYREILFRRIRATVERDEDVMAEASHLIKVFSR